MIDLNQLREAIQRDRVFVHADDGDRSILDDLMEDLKGWERDCLAAVAREQELRKQVAKARAWLRSQQIGKAYDALGSKYAPKWRGGRR